MGNARTSWTRVWAEGVGIGSAAGAAFALSYLATIATGNYAQNGVLDPPHWLAALAGTMYYIGLPIIVVGVLLGIIAITVPSLLFPVLRGLPGMLASVLHAVGFIVLPVLVLSYLAVLAPAFGVVAAATLCAAVVGVTVFARLRLYPPARELIRTYRG